MKMRRWTWARIYSYNLPGMLVLLVLVGCSFAPHPGDLSERAREEASALDDLRQDLGTQNNTSVHPWNISETLFGGISYWRWLKMTRKKLIYKSKSLNGLNVLSLLRHMTRENQLLHQQLRQQRQHTQQLNAATKAGDGWNAWLGEAEAQGIHWQVDWQMDATHPTSDQTSSPCVYSRCLVVGINIGIILYQFDFKI